MFIHTPYEKLLCLLRVDLPPYLRARIEAELRSRNRALYNQYVQINGGEFK
jgi:hypothetical protein